MLTVDDYAKIRLAHRDGMSIRAIARAFGHSRRKVREVLAQAQPKPYTRSKPPPAPPPARAAPPAPTGAVPAAGGAPFVFSGRVRRGGGGDTPAPVVAQIFRGRDRRPNERYAALASHYAFEALFCMPARGNEKPYAETRVRVLQRQWATPVPRCTDLGALNAYLRQRCAGEVGRTVAGYDESIGSRFARDQ